MAILQFHPTKSMTLLNENDCGIFGGQFNGEAVSRPASKGSHNFLNPQDVFNIVDHTTFCEIQAIHMLQGYQT